MNNYNQNDFVIVNGKKYFAFGGNTLIIDPNKIIDYINNYNYGSNHHGKSYYTTPETEEKSTGVGMDLFRTYPPEIQKKIKENRIHWINALRSRYKYDIIKDKNGHEQIPVTDSKGNIVYNVDLDELKKTNNFNDINSQYANGLMYKIYPYEIQQNTYKRDKNGNLIQNDKKERIKVDSDDDQLMIPSGDNIFHQMLVSRPNNNLSVYNKNEWDDLKIMGMNLFNRRKDGRYWSRNEDKNTGGIYYNFYKVNSDGYSDPAITLVYDPKNKSWQQYSDKGVTDIDISKYRGKNIAAMKETPEGEELIKLRYDIDNNRNSKKNSNGKTSIMTGNSLGVSFDGDDTGWTGSVKQTNACGGRTSRRTYAEGGSIGTPIPLGEQEDYNMVGAGGSHEINPQGGVPYGMNQDGTQNMVEEGEVSVGNNVFSDRIQLSPELCQQLGLPEGTTPAQAMQQINALYEQGQIKDDEFQEIQEIIFQDQEQQKQGEEMQQEMPPNEGISPDMIQGANMPQGGGMPPEMMQQQGAPMTPQNEGIQPEMVQGYAYGGRMW